MVGESFLAKTGSTTLNCKTTKMTDVEIYKLDPTLSVDQVPGAWNFTVSGSGYTSGDPVFLSFDIGERATLDRV